jgi:hypothetical protein
VLHFLTAKNLHRYYKRFRGSISIFSFLFTFTENLKKGAAA